MKVMLSNEYKLGEILIERGLQVAVAESCTGGLLSSRLTDVSGASAYTRANFVTYSHEAKHLILGVSEETLERFGAVSEECAREMAFGLINKTNCDLAICTTGFAGPTVNKIGLIYISVAYKPPLGIKYSGPPSRGGHNIVVKKFQLNPEYDRKKMKFMFTEKALEMALEIIGR